MKTATRKLVNKIVVTTTLICMTTQGTLAAFLDLAQIPLFIGGNIPPKVMLTISKDQQLYKKAYNDYTDLNIPPDGTLETTYAHGIDYYGYFDPYKCYVYSANMFRPDSPLDTNKTHNPLLPANDPVNLAAKYCNSATTNQWSGNFLNWVSMSRMDTVRKLLYGGMRFVDGTAAPGGVSLTVLERAYLPADAHAWAKYYNGTDIAQLTPFNPPTAPTTNLASTAQITDTCGADFPQTSRPYSTLGFAVPVTAQTPNGNQVWFVAPFVPVPVQIPPLVTPMTGGTFGPCIYPTNQVTNATFPLYTSPGQPAVVASAPATVNIPSLGGPVLAPAVPVWEIDVPFTTNMTAAPHAMAVGDQIRIESAAFVSRGTTNTGCGGAATPCMMGTVVRFSNANQTVRLRVSAAGVVGSGASNSWHVTNLSRTGVSFCNVTTDAGGGIHSASQTNRNPPLIRVARGNYGLWNANEIFQCKWLEEKSGTAVSIGGTGSNGNQAAISGLNASADNPGQSAHGFGFGSAVGEFRARVEACVVDKFGTERCKRYQNGNYKPIGLLQEYGDVNLIHFGLMTGSYHRNVQGGVLRKNVDTFNDEVNHDTDGTFKHPGAPGNAAVLPGPTRNVNSAANTTAGIVNTLNYMRVWGYSYTTGQYGGDSCTGQLTAITDNRCTSWGNPMAEIYFESLRYFAGGKFQPQPAPQPSEAYKIAATGTKDNQLGLPLPAWQDKLDTSNYCAPLNVVVFNASVSTNEEELRPITATDVNSSLSAGDLTTAVGAHEGINGKSFFAGKIIGGSATPPGSTDFELCTAKNIPGLGDVSGICPEGPSVAGSFLIAGLAHHARTNKVRADIPLSSSDKRSLRVTTYGIQLSTNVPQLVIPVPGPLPAGVLEKDRPKVVIQPIYRLEIPAAGTPFRSECPAGQRCFGGGTLVDLKFITPPGPDPLDPANPLKSYGKVYINWEDSEQGNDFDQDMYGTLEWRLDASTSPKTITVTTNAITQSTVNPQGFGFSISGTKDRDGPHFFSGIAGRFGSEHLPFNFPGTLGQTGTVVDTGASTPGCVNCRASDDAQAGQKGPVRSTFEIGTSSAGTLNDPLWYAAKYGAFIDNDGDGKPDNVNTAEWDSRLSNGQQGSDGIPDTYFLVSNPLGLVAALDRAFVSILSNASASSVATNSTSLQTGTTIYQARFNANDWSGQVLAFTVSTGDPLTGEAAGTISQIPVWDAGQIVNFQDPLSTAPPAATTPSKVPSLIAGAGRTILTYNDSPTSRRGVPFRWPSSLPATPTAADLAALPPTDIGERLVRALNFTPGASPVEDFRGQDRLNYLRGSQTSEGVGVAGFRARPTSRLGDIVNSNPNFVGAPNAGFGESTYAAFRQQNIGRKPMIYVGGNDGMLHAFRAEDGREVLAYVPSMVHDKLNRLPSKTYVGVNAREHRYFVDGSPEISDAFVKVGTGNEWRTVLVSGLGAGGQGVFALNITQPQEFAETRASEIAMWEFSDKDDPDMGYVLAQPIIRRTAVKDANGNNRWAAIVSSGYNNSEPQPGELASTVSATGSAYFFIIFLDGPGTDGVWDHGSDYIKIRAQLGTDDPASPNGLTQPLAADVNRDGIVDYLYAGDLRGNLWKFDMTSTTASDWNLAENRVILFTAMDTASPSKPQPITAPPEATLHPDLTTFIITFGTGKYLEPTDPFNPPGTPVPPATKVPYQIQSFYGIWDRNDVKPIAGQTVVSARSLLLGHEIKSDTTFGFRVVIPLEPANIDEPNWFRTFSPPNPVASDPVNAEHMGWYLDFPATDPQTGRETGERSVFRPILTSGRLIFTTLLPLTDACEFGGTSFIMVIDPTTGGRINAAVLDVRDNTTLNSDDKVSFIGGTADVFASGAKSGIGITPTPTIIKTDSTPAGTGGAGSKILGTSGPLVAASGVLLAYALAAGSSGGNASTMIGLSAAGGRVSWREVTSDGGPP